MSLVLHVPASTPNEAPSEMEIVAAWQTHSDRVAHVQSVQNARNLLPDELPFVADARSRSHLAEPAEIFMAYGVDLATGLSHATAQQRLAALGFNMLPKPRVKPAWFRFVEQLFRGFGVILWAAAILCLVAWKPIGDPPDLTNLLLFIILIVVIFLQAGFSFWQDFKANRVISAFSNKIPLKATVMRDGGLSTVPATELTIGDVVILNMGDNVPADCRLVEVEQLRVDNSCLTGESEPVRCTITTTEPNLLLATNMVWMGTAVVEGKAKGIVTATGHNTEMAKVVAMASTQDKPTTLEVQILWFIRVIVALAMITAAVLILVYVFSVRKKYPGFLSWAGIITNIIGTVVAYVPDGLPFAIAVTITVIARTLIQKYDILVSRLTTVETLGSVSVIASDKTGTLTCNKMTVVHVSLGSELALGAEALDAELAEQAGSPVLEGRLAAVCRAASLCNSATLVIGPTGPHAEGPSAVDVALVNRFAAFVPAMHQRYPTKCTVPFSSRTKCMTTIHGPLPEKEGGGYLLVSKGAPEYMVPRCTSMAAIDSADQALDEAATLALYEKWGSCGERVIALCERRLSPQDFPDNFVFDPEAQNFPTDNLRFLGLVGVQDPPRPSVPDAIHRCKQAGIKVMMVTGDHHTTAAAIAQQVGIFDASIPVSRVPDRKGAEVDSGAAIDGSVLVVGSEIPELTERDWDWVLAHTRVVFSRTTPEQKLTIVKQSQLRGAIVAVTGDGANDAPALKQADCGVAMGEGTEVARAAACMVLLSNDFAAIVSGIEMGRCAYDNLKKVIIYLLPAGSWSEMLPVLANVFLGMPLPLSPFLMLVICVGTDCIASMAIVREPPEPGCMTRPPRNPKRERLVDVKLLLNAYFFTGMIESVAGFLSFFLYMNSHGIKPHHLVGAFNKWTDGYLGRTGDELNDLVAEAQSFFFITLVCCQIANLLSTRCRNVPAFPIPIPALTASFISSTASIAIAVIVTEVPAFHSGFGTHRVHAKWWGFAWACAAVQFTLLEFRKFLVRRFPHSIIARVAW
eukprot:TRINITY_DN254_c0_g4_i1.p1 TRINITY_DN254_c0_g4~~TRINITY_DN254_c0_g4_i1.p1  ORF type:complete len:1027 (+),score=164.33 TRINITY_DN254_c0_g4_i1:49-3129(+)